MFAFFEDSLTREHFISIAQDCIAHLKGERKARSLALVVAALERWKLEQATADGMVEVRGVNVLSDRKVRRPVSDVQPWECADSGANCDAELYVRLAYGDHYPPAEDTHRNLGLNVPIALLLERDAKTMPVESLAAAIRLLWIGLSARHDVYRDKTHKHVLGKAAATAQRLEASALGAAAKHSRAEYAKAEWRSIATQLWRVDQSLKVEPAASMVIEELRIRGHKVEDMPARATVRDALKGFKAHVLKDLARSNQRAKKPA